MDPESATLLNGVAFTLAMLVSELDKAGALSKGDFVRLLRRTAQEAQADSGAELTSIKRSDLILIRLVADLVEEGPDQGGGDARAQ